VNLGHVPNVVQTMQGIFLMSVTDVVNLIIVRGFEVVDKYVNDEGKVGVIISTGYGAGWSTGNDDDLREFLCMDKTLVEMCLRGVSQDDVGLYLNEVFGEHYIYTNGWYGTKVVWLDVGDAFKVDCFDGFERLIICDSIIMVA
jgi:hypothetical protein